jgi:hypothetical protein
MYTLRCAIHAASLPHPQAFVAEQAATAEVFAVMRLRATLETEVARAQAAQAKERMTVAEAQAEEDRAAAQAAHMQVTEAQTVRRTESAATTVASETCRQQPRGLMTNERSARLNGCSFRPDVFAIRPSEQIHPPSSYHPTKPDFIPPKQTKVLAAEQAAACKQDKISRGTLQQLQVSLPQSRRGSSILLMA